MRITSRARPLLGRVFTGLLALLATLASVPQMALAQSQAYVIELIQVSSVRFSRDLTDFTYRIRVTNQGGAFNGATAFVASASANTVILDNEVVLGTVGAGTTLTSTDTFTLRQNRLVAFNPSHLTWNIEGQAANTRPVANAGPDQTVRTGVVVTLNATGSTDADGHALTYRWVPLSKPNGSTATLAATTAPMPTFTVDRGGTYEFQLFVNDGYIDSLPDVVRISTLNSTPVANAGPDRTVARNAAVTLDGSASADPDFDALSFNWSIVSAPSGSTATLSGAAAAKPTIVLDRPGSYTFRLTVSDGQLTSTPDEVTISTANSAPLANAGEDRTTLIGTSVVLDGRASSDADNDALTFAWTWLSRPTGSAAALNAPNTPQPSFAPDKAGLYVVQLIVNDGFANSAPDTTIVTIDVPPNHAPVAGDDAATTPSGNAVDINVLANDTDADAGNVLSVASFTQPANGSVTSVAGGLRFTPAAGFSGVTTFDYVVSDGQASDTGTVTVTVTSGNAAPTVNAGADSFLQQPYRDSVAAWSLNGSVTDDGRPTPAHLVVGWVVVSGPGPVSFATPASTSTNAEFSVAGGYVLRLTASDGQAVASDDVMVSVQPAVNAAPQLADIADRTIALGSTLKLQIAASDTDPHDALTFALGAAPSGATLDASQLSWTPSNAQVGQHVFNLSVHDTAGLSDTAAFRVTVTNGNRAPQLGALSNDATVAFAQYTKVLSATDPDGDTLTLSLLQGPSGMTLAGNTLSWQPDATQTSASTVKVSVTDGRGGLAAGLFKVTVGSNAAPIARDDKYSVKLGETLTIAAPGLLSNDVDPDDAALTASKRSDPSLGTLTNFNANGSFTFQAPSLLPPATMAVQEMWRADASGQWVGSFPVMGDVNGDGAADLVLTSQFIGDRAIDGRTGATLWNFDQTGYEDCRFDFTSTTVPLLADVDDDGKLEYVGAFAGCSRDARVDRIFAFDATTGKVKWMSPQVSRAHPDVRLAGGVVPTQERDKHVYEGTSWASMHVARLTANGTPTLMFRKVISRDESAYNDPTGTIRGAGCRGLTGVESDEHRACRVTVLMSGLDGSVQQFLTAPNDTNSYQSGSWDPMRETAPFAADLNGDGQLEIVSGSDVWGRVGGVWTLLWQSKYDPAQVLAADLDGDGRAEVIQNYASPKQGYSGEGYDGFYGLVIRDGMTGTEIRRINWPFYWTAFLTVADADGDGAPDFVINTQGTVMMLNAQGLMKWTYQIPVGLSNYNTEPGSRSGAANAQVYDLDGDGTPEVVTNTTTGVLVLNGRTGEVKVRYASQGLHPSYGSIVGVQVIDADNDGHADIVATNVSGPDRLSYIMLSGAPKNWLPGPKIHHQANFMQGDVEDNGHVNFNTAVPKSFRNPKQLGTVRDSRAALGTSFTYAASDGAATSAPANVFIEITPQNAPPEFTSMPPRALWQRFGWLNFYQVTATDADPGDVITYSFKSAPSWAHIDATTGRIDFDFTCGSYGYPCPWGMGFIVVVATDSRGGSAEQTFMINLTTESRTVPNLVGQTFDAANATLQAQSLFAAKFNEVYGPQPAGTVIGQDPVATTTVAKDADIRLTVSKGPAPVITPNVVGQGETVAGSAFNSRGFTTAITRQYSTTIAAGKVIAQTPPAGTEVVPGNASLTISLGTGLVVRLNRAYSPANQPITASIVAVDQNQVETTFVGATLAIAGIGPRLGAIPMVSGATITPNSDTRGAFRLTATDPVTGRIANAEFVIAAPASATSNVDVGSFAAFAATVAQVSSSMRAARVAARAGDQVMMVTRTREAVTQWRALDQTYLRLSSPLSPEGGLPPRVSDMAGFGVVPTPEDALNVKVLENSVAALTELIEGLQESHTPHAAIDTLVGKLSTVIEPLSALAPSEYGMVQAQSEYSYLGSRLIPDWMDALMDEMGRATGMPERTAALQPSAPRLDSMLAALTPPEAHIYSTLSEQLTTLAVNQVVEQINVVQQFQNDIMKQARSGALLVMLASHLRQSLASQELVEVVAGGSLSIRAFRQPYSMIEGIDFEEKYPILNDVVFLGPETVSPVQDVVDEIKGLSVSSLAESVASVAKIFYKLKALSDSGNDAASAGSQPVHEASRPCIFSLAPNCVQLLYPSGFYSVYDYNAPPGFPSAVVGLPVPIIVIARSRTGQFYISTPPFIPYRPGID